MELDEARAIQQYVLTGKPVQENAVKEARRIVLANNASGMELRCGENRAWMPAPISTAQRERVNMILAYRLALACGLLSAWRAAS